MIRFFSVFCFIFLSYIQLLQGQDRTVGLLSYQPELAFDGYNLFFPHGQSTVYLIDNCGEIINSWDGDPDDVPGNSVYLTSNGDLVRASRFFDRTGDAIWAGGGGAFIDALDWDGNVQWSFELNNDTSRLHHDFEILPDGNVLMIAWEKIEGDEVIENGRDTSNLPQNELWPDFILEYDPIFDSIVWKWHAWDHLVQDFDSSKLNFGIVEDHPERINVNFETNGGLPDWLHSNSIDYNEDLDQIILSVPHFNEVWIIDHSTTIEEAAGSKGGRAGKGGDLLFRWGNPAAYQQGDQSEQKLFFQHDAQWIRDFVNDNDERFDQILIFNNRAGENFSAVNILNPVLDENDSIYLAEAGVFLPSAFEQTINHPLLETYYSSGLSSAQYLPNGNLLILSGRYGYAFELTEEGEVVWEYRVPLISGQEIDQGQRPIINENLTFRMKRYPIGFSAFEGKDLSQKGSIQTNEVEDFCNRVVPSVDIGLRKKVSIYPNPVHKDLNIELGYFDKESFSVIDLNGREMMHGKVELGYSTIDVSSLQSGIYFLRLTSSQTYTKFVKVTH